MTNTKYNYYKTVKWKDLVVYFKFDNYKYTSTTYSNKYKNFNWYKLTNKIIMRKLVKKFRRDNKLAKEINLISTKEQYWY